MPAITGRLGLDPERQFIDCKHLLQKIPTRFQDPFKFEIVQNRINEIHNGANAIGLRLAKLPVVGTLPSSSIHAEARQEFDENLIILNNGTIDFIWALAKVIAMSLPSDALFSNDPLLATWNDVSNHLEENPEAAINFSLMVNGVRGIDQPFSSSRFSINSDSVGFAHVLQLGMEYFVFGHEYAHFSEDHLNGVVRGLGEDVYQDVPIHLSDHVFQPNRSYRKEFDADQVGIYFGKTAIEDKGANGDAALVSAVLFLHAYGLINESKASIDTKTRQLLPCNPNMQISGGHPTAVCRIELLKLHANKSVELMHRISLVENIVTHLWNRIALLEDLFYEN